MNTPIDLNGATPAPHARHGDAAVVIAIHVNGVTQHTSARTLAQWLRAQDAPPTGLATAVNGQFVPRYLREQQKLAEGDTIVTFQPIEGG
jgi:sulfur carrier protein